MSEIPTTPEPTPSPSALQSPTIGKLAGALAKAQGQMRHALKDSENPHFRSRYADLASVIDAIREALSSNGLAYVQRPMPAEGGVCLNTMLLHAESGEWISDGGLYLPASKRDAQGYGSALTYARRYALAALVGVAQDDDDGNAAVASAPKQQQRRYKGRPIARPDEAPPAPHAPVSAPEAIATEDRRQSLENAIKTLHAADQKAIKAKLQRQQVVWGRLTDAQADEVQEQIMELVREREGDVA